LTSHVRSSSATAPRLPDAGQSSAPQMARLRISRFPSKELLDMPGSSTTPGRSELAMVRPKRVAFRARNSVGTRGLAFAAQWLAYALPYRRFVGVLTDANARLGADVDRYSFIVVDLHHLLLAGLPAHFESHHPSHAFGSLWRVYLGDAPWTERGPRGERQPPPRAENAANFFGRARGRPMHANFFRSSARAAKSRKRRQRDSGARAQGPGRLVPRRIPRKS